MSNAVDEEHEDNQGCPEVLVTLADGTEEIEAVTIIDTLRRAGCQVVVASCADEQQVTCSRGVRVVADTMIDGCHNRLWDMIVLPGGLKGAEQLRDHITLSTLLQEQHNAQRWIAAICAAPAVILAQHGFLNNVRATCYPTFLQQLPHPELELNITVVRDDDSKIITSQGPGTAMDFALELVAVLQNKEKAIHVAEGMRAILWDKIPTEI